MTDTVLTDQQEEAIARVHEWWDLFPDKPFKLFGYAGTGKTTIGKEIAKTCSGQVLFGAYTGKAALVMRQKGCSGAMTIHTMNYKPKNNEGFLQNINSQLETLKLNPEENAEKIEELEQELAEGKDRGPQFAVNENAPITTADLVILDECSMIGAQVGRDLMERDVPILCLGDPAQLPPVGDAGYFTKGKPDFLLTEIHRQAEGSPIIKMATDVREGRGLEIRDYGDGCRVIPKSSLRMADIVQMSDEVDQIICGRNKTRRNINNAIRKAKGHDNPWPVAGDKIICVNNEKGSRLMLNGNMFQVVSDAIENPENSDRLIFDAVPDGENEAIRIEAHKAPFCGDEVQPWDRKQASMFEYGYAITCHKSQGSQWDKVLVRDESFCFRSNAKNWLYTAITRAANQVTIIQG